jgi:hypothetical protein
MRPDFNSKFSTLQSLTLKFGAPNEKKMLKNATWFWLQTLDNPNFELDYPNFFFNWTW